MKPVLAGMLKDRGYKVRPVPSGKLARLPLLLDLLKWLGLRLPDRTAFEQAHADFRIEGPTTHGVRGIVNLFGIESPGLTSSLAIAERVGAIVADA